jgi:Capsular polysaccharide biosynthesis protein
MMKVNNITIVSKATVNLKAIFPNKKIFTVAGILIGIIVGIFVALLRQYLDKTVKDTDFLTNDLGLVNLGQIYHIKDSEKSFSVVRVDTKEKNKADNYAGRRRV